MKILVKDKESHENYFCFYKVKKTMEEKIVDKASNALKMYI